ncbi:SDR family NAD(P)-dependent oxidoreductase [Rhizobium sp. TRM95111]|uniref:SDR family NAD(P)-dependent oxidoreductase n=1 Tax=Rhizobium alarense TaxID=2846851 RepID=UPI001F28A980|nr:SDR family NAD(P)-dependent oxidoreductase [Rhizobium alarense]MCF3642603.1 SDR family NAD(P)-dependent oxidoreductase [Rhizobium alarense]
MTHPAFTDGKVAVITGAASGIGRAAALRLAAAGLKVALADLDGPRLREAGADVAAVSPGGEGDVLVIPTDVSDRTALEALQQAVVTRFGDIHVLMNNAGVQPGSALFGAEENWQKVLAVNLWGVIHGSRVFAPGMIAHGEPALIINTGSKQGITTPPGDPAYNVSKAAVKVFTEALQHDLRNTEGCKVSAHLLIPGFVFTGLTARGRADKPDGAWTAEQTVDFMMESIARGDFYVLCPDNEVDRATDEKRILWAAGDIVENRPPLSRWHPDYGDAFRAFLTRT